MLVINSILIIFFLNSTSAVTRRISFGYSSAVLGMVGRILSSVMMRIFFRTYGLFPLPDLNAGFRCCPITFSGGSAAASTGRIICCMVTVRGVLFGVNQNFVALNEHEHMELFPFCVIGNRAVESKPAETEVDQVMFPDNFLFPAFALADRDRSRTQNSVDCCVCGL